MTQPAQHTSKPASRNPTPHAPPPLRWEKIYEARERLAQGNYDSDEEVEAVASWLDQVFGNEKRSARA